MKLGGSGGSVTYTRLGLEEIWTLTSYCLSSGIQNICPMFQKLKILIRPLA